MTYRVLDLFSGIGGFSLGLERTNGFKTVAFCEIEEFPRRVLAKHWPGVPIYDDVRTLTADRLRADGIAVDVICGGFPCQDISVAGKGAGIDGARSGLWSEYARLIGELRPSYVIVENVAALLGRGMDRVLGDLAALGFDAEWHCIPASAVGAPHRRDRLWIVAHPEPAERGPHAAPRQRMARTHSVPQWQEGAGGFEAGGEDVAHPDSSNGYGRGGFVQVGRLRIASEIANNGDAGRTQWGTEPGVGRVAHGISARVDRLCGLGNAVVPQIPELIGRAILASEAA